ncbi:hypothetical protein CYMTET_29338, partial [Cymbomonas tetramitiformis]
GDWEQMGDPVHICGGLSTENAETQLATEIKVRRHSDPEQTITLRLEQIGDRPLLLPCKVQLQDSAAVYDVMYTQPRADKYHELWHKLHLPPGQTAMLDVPHGAAKLRLKVMSSAVSEWHSLDGHSRSLVLYAGQAEGAMCSVQLTRKRGELSSALHSAVLRLTPHIMLANHTGMPLTVVPLRASAAEDCIQLPATGAGMVPWVWPAPAVPANQEGGARVKAGQLAEESSMLIEFMVQLSGGATSRVNFTCTSVVEEAHVDPRRLPDERRRSQRSLPHSGRLHISKRPVGAGGLELVFGWMSARREPLLVENWTTMPLRIRCVEIALADIASMLASTWEPLPPLSAVRVVAADLVEVTAAIMDDAAVDEEELLASLERGRRPSRGRIFSFADLGTAPRGLQLREWQAAVTVVQDGNSRIMALGCQDGQARLPRHRTAVASTDREFTLQTLVKGACLSVVDNKPEELLLLSVDGLRINYGSGCRVACGACQRHVDTPPDAGWPAESASATWIPLQMQGGLRSLPARADLCIRVLSIHAALWAALFARVGQSLQNSWRSMPYRHMLLIRQDVQGGVGEGGATWDSLAKGRDSVLGVRLDRLQLDDQRDFTLFPTILAHDHTKGAFFESLVVSSASRVEKEHIQPFMGAVMEGVRGGAGSTGVLHVRIHEAVAWRVWRLLQQLPWAAAAGGAEGAPAVLTVQKQDPLVTVRSLIIPQGSPAPDASETA